LKEGDAADGHLGTQSPHVEEAIVIGSPSLGAIPRLALVETGLTELPEVSEPRGCVEKANVISAMKRTRSFGSSNSSG
jgi:hypothetical protein